MYEQAILKMATPGVLRILDYYRSQSRLAELAKKVDIAAPRLSELLNGKRDLSFTYLTLFIYRGGMTLEQVFSGQDLTKLPKEAHLVLERLKMDDELVELVVKAKKEGIDLKALLRSVTK